MKKVVGLALATAVFGAVAIGPVNADTRSYRVEASTTKRVTLRLCEERVRVRVTGDTDTDLDFRIIDANGQQLYWDESVSDRTSTTLDNGRGCNTYTLYVINLGDVYNDFRITLTDATNRDRTTSY
jgi:uncharacterized protein YfaP (DUF2135 family)